VDFQRVLSQTTVTLINSLVGDGELQGDL
jgi:hypothetical protein